MEKTKVVNFNQSDEFYFKFGKAQLEKGEFINAIKSFHKAISLVKSKNEFLLSSYYLLLAQSYAFIGLYELSNYYYFLSLSSDLFAQVAFRGLGENFYFKEEYDFSKFYLNKCINLSEENELSISAKNRIKMIDEKSFKGFRVIKTLEEENRDKEILKAHCLMSRGIFNGAIEIFENNKVYEDANLRAELSLAYFFTNETDKGIELINKYGNEDSLLDLCNLYLIYFFNNDEDKRQEIKEKLLNFDIKREEDNFKLGLAFAQTGELILAKKYMKKYLSKEKYSLELNFLYVLCCINNKDFDEAREELLNLKAVNPFDSYIFDYYLKICNGKKVEKLEYIFGLPIKENLKIKTYIKNCLLLGEDELKKEFQKNKSLFYCIAGFPNCTLKELFLLKLSKIQDEELNKFFEYVLVKVDLKNNVKNNIAFERIKFDDVNYIFLVKDNIFSKIVLPNKIATKSVSKTMYKVSLNAVKYILFETNIMFVNLKYNIILMERKKIEENENEFVLAAILTWLTVGTKRYATLRQICSYFKITQQEFYQVAEKYNINI